MSAKEDFLMALTSYRTTKNRLQELAWQIAPDDIKELLCGKDGLFEGIGAPEKILEEAKKWLIKPRSEFDGKCATKTIIDGDDDKVRILLDRLIAETYF